MRAERSDDGDPVIERKQLVADAKRLTSLLIDDLRVRSDEVDEVGELLRGQFAQAQAAGRTERAYEDWREDQLAQVAVGWVLASVFVRFCEDNALIDTPLISGPGDRLGLARDHRASWLGENPAEGDRAWLVDVFDRYAAIEPVEELFGGRNPLRQFGPTDDGARAILDLWWSTDDEGHLVHDFTDPAWDTRFLGDLYQDLSDHAKSTYALLQTPEFVEEFILDRTLDPAIETFGLDQVRMIDPTCGSGHFLLGAFHRLLDLWRDREPGTPSRVLAQNALDAVNGVDLNPFAAAIARFRLLVAALKAGGVERLADAPAYTINVAVGDSLLHGTYAQTTLFSGGDSPLDQHRYPSEDGELAAELLTRGRYHAVVGNPPYITVKDPALSTAYRERYPTCHRKYSLGVPFTELFFQLAGSIETLREVGYVGMITANSFMKREMGKPLVEEFFGGSVELSGVVDTSGAFIPGHGTPTVILFGRNRRPTGEFLRVVLGVNGEPEPPRDASHGLVWRDIIQHFDDPGYESTFISVEDAPRGRFARHPWSLQGGAAPAVLEAMEISGRSLLSEYYPGGGFFGITGADEVFLLPRGTAKRKGSVRSVILMLDGERVREWAGLPALEVHFPYRDGDLVSLPDMEDPWRKYLWEYRAFLEGRRTFGKRSYREEGRPWWEWHQVVHRRLGNPWTLTFAGVSTHNHFALLQPGVAANSSARILEPKEHVSRTEAYGCLGILNSSLGAFWIKQVSHNKGEGGGARVDAGYAAKGAEAWRDTYDYDGTKLKQFPLPAGRPLARASALDGLAQQLSDALPTAVAERAAPTAATLETSRARAAELQSRMVALQEELDWECYRLYGLADDDLTFPTGRLPLLERGQRAFEIVLARKMAAGEATTTWFERHDATPITDLPDDWPADYRQLVERRIELILSDRSLGLVERPEYKRRWNWEPFDKLQRDALRMWLLDRLEASELWPEPQLSSTSRLADRLRGDATFTEVARLYAGSDADLADVVADLVAAEAVPYVAAYRYKPSGLRKRQVWEQVWDLQRREDAIDARASLPSDHADHLDVEGVALAKKELGKIPVPPKYGSGDFVKTSYWRLRGKLDVPKERFVLYPGTRVGSDSSPVIGWAGWDHLEQARALAGHLQARIDDGAEPEELTGLLAGLAELVPWLVQWHNEVDPEYGEQMGDFFATFVDTQARDLGLTPDDLATWQPPAPTRGRKKAR